MLNTTIYNQWSQISSYIQTLWWIPSEQEDWYKDKILTAFVHKSYASDFVPALDHNERYEFLWDGILWWAIAFLLFESHPEWSEAQMTLYKIALVREEMLAQVAREIRLTDQVSTINVSNKLAHHQRERLTALVSIKLSDNHDIVWKSLNDETIASVSPIINEDQGGILTALSVREVLFAPLMIRFQKNTSSLILLISTYSSVPSTKTSVRRRSNAHIDETKKNSIAKKRNELLHQIWEKRIKRKDRSLQSKHFVNNNFLSVLNSM